MLRFDSFQKNKVVEDDTGGGHNCDSTPEGIPDAVNVPERSLGASTMIEKNDSLSDLMQKELDGDAVNGHDSTQNMPCEMTKGSSSSAGRGSFWGHKKPSIRPPRPPMFSTGLSGLTIVTKHREIHDEHVRSSDRSLASKASASPSTHNDPSEFLWQELDAAFLEACPPHNAAVQHILKLCFSSLCVVFRETKLNHNHDSSNKHPFLYERIPSIPAAAAQMLWSELLGGIECVKKEGDGRYHAQLKQAQTTEHDEMEEDSPEATAVPLACDPAVTPEEVRKFIKHINDTAQGTPSSFGKMLRRISAFGPSSEVPGSPSAGMYRRRSVHGLPNSPSTSKPLSTTKWFSFRHNSNDSRNQVLKGQISMSELQEQERQERPQGKDLLLYCVRDHLVQAGFVEIAGRRVDDDEEEEDEMDSLGSSDDETSVSTYEREDGKMDNVDVDDELAMDFSGWGKPRKTRKVRRTQYLQIYKDMKQMYGVYLASLSESEGGFAVEASDDESLSVERSSLELETMKRWDEDMAQACVRQLQSDSVLLDTVVSVCHRRSAVPYSIEIQPEPNAEDSTTFGTADGDDSSDEKKMETDRAKRDWWTKLRSDNPFRDASSYAIRYYPTHMMRSGHVVDTAHLLMSRRFFLSRVCAFGPSEAVQLHTANLDELKKRCDLAVQGLYALGGDGDCIDPEDILFAAMQVMINVMEERFPAPSNNKKFQKLKGEHEDGDIGRAYHQISSLMADKEDVKLASRAYELALVYKIASLGENHISVARTFRHKGHLHLNQLEYDKAIHCYTEAVKIERFQDEVDHKKVILSLNSIAVIHGMRQEHEEAIDSYSQSLVIQKAHLGETHPQVAETLNSLGIIYGMRGDYDRAVMCYKEALGIKLDGAGQESDEVADIQFNLGLVQFKRGDNEAAIEAFQQALQIRQALVGEEHEEVARVLYHLGVVLEDMGELVEAAEQYEESLRLRRRIVGDDHEDVARTLHNLGLVYFENGDYERSLERFEDALRLRREHSAATGKVADILHAIGMVYQKTIDFGRAIECYSEAVEIRRSELGNDHIEVASTLHNMGDIYYMMGELDRAMECYNEAFDIRLDHLGQDNVDVAATRNNMGVVFMKRNDHQQAMDCFSAALLTRQKQLGPNHEKVSDTLHNMGLVHKNLQEYPQAIERYEQALRIRRQQAHNDHDKIKVADTLYNMAIVFANTENYRSALDRYKEALRTYRETGMTDDHPSIINTLQWIRWAEKKLHKQQSKRNLVSSSSQK